jgi:hypothetical protein
MSTPSYLEMSSDSTDKRGVPHYAYYLVLRIFPSFPTEIIVLCHHAKTNHIFLHGGRVGPSPITRANKVEIFIVETMVLQIGFRSPSDFSTSTMYLYWEQNVAENYRGIKHSLNVADVSSFRNFIESFRNVGDAQALVANIKL